MRLLYALYALVIELLMLAALATWALAAVDGPGGAVLAVAVVVLVGGLWGRFLAPKAPHPLAPGPALAAKTVLLAGTGALVVAAGFGIFGVLLAAAGLVLVGLEARFGTAAAQLGRSRGADGARGAD